ncbi:MAG: L-rhamnose isomerase [Planctomycetes bacterium]|nr:L-rhamnose isomerase [Planctomycetota bacterium]
MAETGWPSPAAEQVRERYASACRAYAALDVDADAAVRQALTVPISLHSWQGDDAAGFEVRKGSGGGIMATGNYPGRARDGDELRRDLQQVMALVPGTLKVNLHAFHAETGGKAVQRDALEVGHFARWIAWAGKHRIGLDFNPTMFAHPLGGGLTLSHPDAAVRSFWIGHAVACRRIAEAMARRSGSPCVNNLWIPDGAKDSPADRWGPRRRLRAALDEIYDDSLGIDRRLCIDAVEGKLFGLGVEDYTAGSHEFYWLYALRKDLVPCLDMGHFHPTETVADKLSALLEFHRGLLLHLSRGLRWDSDHVVLWSDDLKAALLELVRGGALDRVYIALDYFDASINRIAAYVIGARAARKAVLYALLDPSARLRGLEAAGRGAQKLALMEEMKTMPFAAAWDKLCLDAGVPLGPSWLADVEAYERRVLAKRR